MKTLQTLILIIGAAFTHRPQLFANESAAPVAESLVLANQLAVDAEGWVQLSPFGDFPNIDGKGAKVIQRFEKADAETIVNEFNSLLNLPSRLLGLPWYVGHPDHPRFKGQPGHTDNSAKGRIKTMEVREDGLYANVKFNSVGRRIVEDEEFHGHSVNWAAIPAGMEGGARIFRPISLKSVGFTNQPQIPVKPATLANEEDGETDHMAAKDVPATAKEVVPPRLKLIAGFKIDDECTMEEVLAALEKAITGVNGMANEKPPLFAISDADGKLVVMLVNEGEGLNAEEFAARFVADLANSAELLRCASLARDKYAEDFSNERKARATEFVNALVKAGKIKTADSAATIDLLCNAADAYETKAAELANVAPVVKTSPVSVRLGKEHAAMQTDAAARRAKLDEMLAKRAQEFPNEGYDERFNAVGNSPEGVALFAQMKRAGAEE